MKDQHEIRITQISSDEFFGLIDKRLQGIVSELELKISQHEKPVYLSIKDTVMLQNFTPFRFNSDISLVK